MGVQENYPAYVMRAIGVFVDGDNLIGDATEYKLPGFELKTDDSHNSGMITDIEMVTGISKPEAGFKMRGFRPDMLQKMGVNLGIGALNTFLLTSALVDDDGGKTHSGVCTIKGFIKKMDPGDWKGGDLPEVEYEISTRECRLEIDGVLVYELTPFTWTINGVSQTDEIQKALLNFA